MYDFNGEGKKPSPENFYNKTEIGEVLLYANDIFSIYTKPNGDKEYGILIQRYV